MKPVPITTPSRWNRLADRCSPSLGFYSRHSVLETIQNKWNQSSTTEQSNLMRRLVEARVVKPYSEAFPSALELSTRDLRWGQTSSRLEKVLTGEEMGGLERNETRNLTSKAVGLWDTAREWVLKQEEGINSLPLIGPLLTNKDALENNIQAGYASRGMLYALAFGSLAAAALVLVFPGFIFESIALTAYLTTRFVPSICPRLSLALKRMDFPLVAFLLSWIPRALLMAVGGAFLGPLPILLQFGTLSALFGIKALLGIDNSRSRFEASRKILVEKLNAGCKARVETVDHLLKELEKLQKDKISSEQFDQMLNTYNYNNNIFFKKELKELFESSAIKLEGSQESSIDKQFLIKILETYLREQASFSIAVKYPSSEIIRLTSLSRCLNAFYLFAPIALCFLAPGLGFIGSVVFGLFVGTALYYSPMAMAFMRRTESAQYAENLRHRSLYVRFLPNARWVRYGYKGTMDEATTDNKNGLPEFMNSAILANLILHERHQEIFMANAPNEMNMEIKGATRAANIASATAFVILQKILNKEFETEMQNTNPLYRALPKDAPAITRGAEKTELDPGSREAWRRSLAYVLSGLSLKVGDMEVVDSALEEVYMPSGSTPNGENLALRDHLIGMWEGNRVISACMSYMLRSYQKQGSSNISKEDAEKVQEAIKTLVGREIAVNISGYVDGKGLETFCDTLHSRFGIEKKVAEDLYKFFISERRRVLVEVVEVLGRGFDKKTDNSLLQEVLIASYADYKSKMPEPVLNGAGMQREHAKAIARALVAKTEQMLSWAKISELAGKVNNGQNLSDAEKEIWKAELQVTFGISEQEAIKLFNDLLAQATHEKTNQRTLNLAQALNGNYAVDASLFWEFFQYAQFMLPAIRKGIKNQEGGLLSKWSFIRDKVLAGNVDSLTFAEKSFYDFVLKICGVANIEGDNLATVDKYFAETITDNKQIMANQIGRFIEYDVTAMKGILGGDSQSINNFSQELAHRITTILGEHSPTAGTFQERCKSLKKQKQYESVPDIGIIDMARKQVIAEFEAEAERLIPKIVRQYIKEILESDQKNQKKFQEMKTANPKSPEEATRCIEPIIAGISTGASEGTRNFYAANLAWAYRMAMGFYEFTASQKQGVEEVKKRWDQDPKIQTVATNTAQGLKQQRETLISSLAGQNADDAKKKTVQDLVDKVEKQVNNLISQGQASMRKNFGSNLCWDEIVMLGTEILLGNPNSHSRIMPYVNGALAAVIPAKEGNFIALEGGKLDCLADLGPQAKERLQAIFSYLIGWKLLQAELKTWIYSQTYSDTPLMMGQRVGAYDLLVEKDMAHVLADQLVSILRKGDNLNQCFAALDSTNMVQDFFKVLGANNGPANLIAERKKIVAKVNSTRMGTRDEAPVENRQNYLPAYYYRLNPSDEATRKEITTDYANLENSAFSVHGTNLRRGIRMLQEEQEGFWYVPNFLAQQIDLDLTKRIRFSLNENEDHLKKLEHHLHARDIARELASLIYHKKMTVEQAVDFIWKRWMNTVFSNETTKDLTLIYSRAKKLKHIRSALERAAEEVAVQTLGGDLLDIVGEEISLGRKKTDTATEINNRIYSHPAAIGNVRGRLEKQVYGFYAKRIRRDSKVRAEIRKHQQNKNYQGEFEARQQLFVRGNGTDLTELWTDLNKKQYGVGAAVGSAFFHNAPIPQFMRPRARTAYEMAVWLSSIQEWSEHYQDRSFLIEGSIYLKKVAIIAQEANITTINEQKTSRDSNQPAYYYDIATDKDFEGRLLARTRDYTNSLERVLEDHYNKSVEFEQDKNKSDQKGLMYGTQTLRAQRHIEKSDNSKRYYRYIQENALNQKKHRPAVMEESGGESQGNLDTDNKGQEKMNVLNAMQNYCAGVYINPERFGQGLPGYEALPNTEFTYFKRGRDFLGPVLLGGLTSGMVEPTCAENPYATRQFMYTAAGYYNSLSGPGIVETASLKSSYNLQTYSSRGQIALERFFRIKEWWKYDSKNPTIDLSKATRGQKARLWGADKLNRLGKICGLESGWGLLEVVDRGILWITSGFLVSLAGTLLLASFVPAASLAGLAGAWAILSFNPWLTIGLASVLVGRHAIIRLLSRIFSHNLVRPNQIERKFSTYEVHNSEDLLFTVWLWLKGLYIVVTKAAHQANDDPSDFWGNWSQATRWIGGNAETVWRIGKAFWKYKRSPITTSQFLDLLLGPSYNHFGLPGMMNRVSSLAFIFLGLPALMVLAPSFFPLALGTHLFLTVSSSLYNYYVIEKAIRKISQKYGISSDQVSLNMSYQKLTEGYAASLASIMSFSGGRMAFAISDSDVRGAVVPAKPVKKGDPLWRNYGQVPLHMKINRYLYRAEAVATFFIIAQLAGSLIAGNFISLFLVCMLPWLILNMTYHQKGMKRLNKGITLQSNEIPWNKDHKVFDFKERKKIRNSAPKTKLGA